MKACDLFKELHRHRKYAGIRNVNFTRNRTAKYVIYSLFAFVIVYLIIIAMGLAFIVNDNDTFLSTGCLQDCFQTKNNVICKLKENLVVCC